MKTGTTDRIWSRLYQWSLYIGTGLALSTAIYYLALSDLFVTVSEGIEGRPSYDWDSVLGVDDSTILRLFADIDSARAKAARYDSLMLLMSSDTSIRFTPTASDSVKALVARMDAQIVSVTSRMQLLEEALTAGDVSQLITVQRLGDKYELLAENVDATMSQIKSLRDDTRRENESYYRQIEGQLDRYTPVIWGLIGTVVLVVFQTFWSGRKKHAENSE